MQKTQAIETYYKNTKFRSRLEARWALFLDELGIMWDYEPQGFESHGIRYLPDFYLPELDYFFEVKPYAPGAEEWIKAAACVKASGKTVIVSWGYPIISPEETLFEMIDMNRFVWNRGAALPREEISFPLIGDKFGMVAVCEDASRVVFGESVVVPLNRDSVGGFETVKFIKCASCCRFHIGPKCGHFKSYDPNKLCPNNGCNEDSSQKDLLAAATKVRNHRFGKIA